jgi:hypothetical protein
MIVSWHNLGLIWPWIPIIFVGCVAASIGFLALAHIPLWREDALALEDNRRYFRAVLAAGVPEPGHEDNLRYHRACLGLGKPSPIRVHHLPAHLRRQFEQLTLAPVAA